MAIEYKQVDLSELKKLEEETIFNLMEEYRKKEEEIFTESLRTNAVPPIVGEITGGKLKWRGIKVAAQHVGFFGFEKWLEQRGKQISPKVVYEGMKLPLY